MKKHLLKLLIAVVLIIIPGIKSTGAYLSDEETFQGITITAGCWGAPTVPILLSPANGTVAKIGSEWLANPVMDWSDSEGCPGATITYQYQSFHDAGLTSLAYNSGVLSISQIPAPGTPDGDYYWHARACDGTNCSEWSDPWKLTVDRSDQNSESNPGPGSVVINEVMWMGSKSHSFDEWIELRNTTGNSIDLSGWIIENAAESHGSLTIPTGKSIGANGYFLIANYSASNSSSSLNVEADWITTGISLSNSYTDNGPLVLKDKNSNQIDRTEPLPIDAKWPSGVHSDDEQSMERNNDPSTGWHSCDIDGCKATTFWDSPNTKNYGTPKAANLSPGDPSEINLDFYKTDATHLAFKLSGGGVSGYEKVEYLITYDSDQTTQGIVGRFDIAGRSEIITDGLFMGSCSSGGTCTPNTGVKDINLTVTLSGTIQKILTSALTN